MKHLHATHLESAVSHISTFGGVAEALNTCDQSWSDSDQLCDPFVKVKIDGNEVLVTEAKEDTQKYVVGRLIMSELIQKNSTIIEIEVWDENKNGRHERLLQTSGTVDTFIEKPYQYSKSAWLRKKEILGNIIVVDVIWQDQREETQPVTSERENVNHRRRIPTDQSENMKKHRPADKREQNDAEKRKHIPKKSSAKSRPQNSSNKNRSNTPRKNKSNNRKNKA